MIESRIKRALWVVSILIALGLGGHSAYKFHEANRLEADGQQWNSLNGAWYAAKCEGEQLDPDISHLCHDAWGTRSFYNYAPNRATNEAVDSLAIAVGIPIGLWTLFFLLRWIWTGRIRNLQSPAAKKPPFFTKQVLYWGLGILGCTFLFAVNVLVLPSGRAVQVLISTAVQGIGLVLVVWIVSKVREARQKRVEQKRAAQPVASMDPPQASDH